MKEFQKMLCCLLCLVFSTYFSIERTAAESVVIDDGYCEYQEVFGNKYSIVELNTLSGMEPNYTVYNPRFCFQTDEYSITVPELLTDGNKLFANVQLQVEASIGIVRPYEFSLENSRYYTPLENYDVPIYFFFTQVSFDNQFGSVSGSWGITDDDRTMNRLVYHTGSRDTYVLNSDGTVDIYFLVSVFIFDGEWHQDDISFVITCPIRELR